MKKMGICEGEFVSPDAKRLYPNPETDHHKMATDYN